MSSPSPPKSLRIGVMLEGVQLSDIVGIDILGNLSKFIIDMLADVEFEPEVQRLMANAIDIKFFYIASTLEPTFVSPSMHFVPTVTYDDCPRDLDIVVTGGPSPKHRPAAADRFIKEAWNQVRVWITTCVGSMWIASAGVLDGVKCTTNREVLPMARKFHPNVEWLDQRWVVVEKPYVGEGKGELWTSGGAGAGIEMIAHYCLQNFGEDFVRRLSLQPLEFDPAGSRGQFY